jgi:acyl carrier protein
MENKVDRGLIGAALRKILVEKAKPFFDIKSETPFTELDIDSLGMWEVLIELEKDLGVEIQESNLNYNALTVGVLTQQLEQQLRERNLLLEEEKV